MCYVLVSESNGCDDTVIDLHRPQIIDHRSAMKVLATIFNEFLGIILAYEGCVDVESHILCSMQVILHAGQNPRTAIHTHAN